MTRFVHPAEGELARILTFHHVRWVYEPTTFVLQRDESGAPTLCFNPDFYLPDHGRYLELTTMRQAHVTRKNRKLRLLRERYPSVDAHLLYRRDFERLAERCRVQASREPAEILRTLVAEDQIDRRVQAIAGACLGRGAPDVLISLGAGAAQFAAELVAAIGAGGVVIAVGSLSLSGSEVTSTARRLRVRTAPRVVFERRRVLLVTDIVSTGLTADFAIRWLRAHGAGPVDVVSLLDRTEARIVRVPLRAAGFPIGDVIAAGHGIGVRRRLGDLPEIVEVARAPG